MRILFFWGLGLTVLAANVAVARPPYKQSLRRYYGDLLPQSMQACATCHLTKQQADDPKDFDEAAPPHNAFGIRLRDLRSELREQGQPADLPSRLRKIAQEDADGDGVANDTEIATGHVPGIAADKPSAEEIAAVGGKLQRFVAQQAGYRWEPFQPVVRPAVPQASRADWNLNPIDAFVAAEHASRGLQPRPEAPRAVLLRRVSLDLVGLPPTPAELHDFLADASPHAYERVVERLLASPHYGERWGRHWMDVWRYSDWAGWTDGKQIRDSQPHIWRWRDWIVESLNADKPYDRMLTEMLAADEVSPADAEALRATGFLARNYKMLSRETWMQDTVNHTLLAFQGLTVGCARCHDHMYDTISQKEYYRLRAIFEPHQVRLDRLAGEADTAKDGLPRVFDADLATATYLFRKGDDRDPDKDHPLPPGVLQFLGDVGYEVNPVTLPPEAYYPALQPHVQQQYVAAADAEVAQADAALKQANESTVAATQQKGAASALDAASVDIARAKAGLAEKILAASQARLASTKARIAADAAKYATPAPATANDLALTAGKAEREAAYAQTVVDTIKAELKRVSALVGVKPDDAKSKQALTDAEKALADAVQNRDTADKARATAVAGYAPLGTVYPKESSGRRTAFARWIVDRRNPLAARVAVNHIWLRHFGQPLVPTVFDFGQNGQPPTHPALVDWLAAELMEPGAGVSAPSWSMKHLHRLLVTSRTYRMASTPDDANLAADPDNRWLWRMPSRRMEAELVRDGILFVAGQLDVALGGPDIDYNLGLTVKRRSVYFRHAQEKQMEFLKIFDTAAVSECYQRKESIIPQQALALANSELTLVQARLIARQLHAATADNAAFVASAFERVLSRPATPEELQTTVAFLNDQQQKLASLAEGVAKTGGLPGDPSKPSADVALCARENLVHVLLNHNDFVMIR